MNKSLLPCPFCGGRAEIIEADEAGDSAYAVQCQTRGCEASSRVAFALKEPVDSILAEAWNRRLPPPGAVGLGGPLPPDEGRSTEAGSGAQLAEIAEAARLFIVEGLRLTPDGLNRPREGRPQRPALPPLHGAGKRGPDPDEPSPDPRHPSGRWPTAAVWWGGAAVSLAYIRKAYGVPAMRGGRVCYSGGSCEQLGTITGASGAHLSIRLDGQRRSTPFHPTWELEYLPEGEAPTNSRHPNDPDGGMCSWCEDAEWRDLLDAHAEGEPPTLDELEDAE